MILDTPVRSLRLVLGEAHTTTACDIVACYGQQSSTGTFVTALSQTASTGTTPVTIVAAPLIGSQNLIQEVRLHNADTVTHTVTLQLLDDATTRTIYSGTVLSGADWVYTPGAGAIASTAGVITFNTRAGVVTLSSADVTTALTYTPYNATNPAGYQTAANVTATLASPPAIGGTVAAAGSFTTLTASSTVSGAGITTLLTPYALLASPTFTGTVTAGATNVGAFTATGITASPISGSTGSFTTLAASSTVSGAGFSTYLASPPAIGGSAAAAGSFTTLAASSTVSGAGFSTYLASPPAIGGSAAAAGAFTTLSASSTVSGAGFTAWAASPPSIGSTSAAAGKFTTLQATGLITPASTIGIVGTTTNDNAQAGSVGEYISSTVLGVSAISLTSGTAVNITTISLTAGDWDVSGTVAYTPAGTTTQTNLQSGISTTTGTLPAAPPWARNMVNTGSFSSGGIASVLPTGTIRMSLSGTTTVYLVADALFATSTMVAYGHIAGRRVR